MAAAAADGLDDRISLRLLYGTSLPHNDGIRKLFLGILNLETATSKNDEAGALRAAKAALMQLETLRYHAKKAVQTCRMTEQEQQLFDNKRTQLQTEIEQAKQDIQQAKVDLVAAQKRRQQLEVYEAKGRDILKHPQRAQSAATMQEVIQNTAAVRQGQADAELALQERRKRFLGLVENVQDLQRCCLADDGSTSTS